MAEDGGQERPLRPPPILAGTRVYTESRKPTVKSARKDKSLFLDRSSDSSGLGARRPERGRGDCSTGGWQARGH